MLRLAAMAGAFGGLAYTAELQSDWKWALAVLNVGALVASGVIRERSNWSDERVKNRGFNIRLIVFIAMALATDLFLFFIKWPK
ncbi:MAG TPA: hypothetical protein PLR18_00435 [bacterium]|nr:hypothetical protein [bacterium]